MPCSTIPLTSSSLPLADEYRERSVGVALSGTGTDGTSGIRVIKESGGLTIVQQPESAKFDGMPRCAISTGLVDWVLPPRKIADEIVNFARYHIELMPEDQDAFSDEESLSRIYLALKKDVGIDITYYKRSTILRRIERRLMVTHTASLAEYANVLDTDNAEVSTLAKEILIGVTSFFRDPAFFRGPQEPRDCEHREERRGEGAHSRVERRLLHG